ncbi:hypothetical protein HII12_001640 [Brettanomyces bruxellensis]|uniref:Serine hydrolase domain-containing protein n=1 Tax=Dekkera bruxellensis TaxID=5007 RepID=A0A8H6EX48_DEKBR|nr:hypothetical protein HII12_001640 [Brettanomyces bruxellensis]
MTPKQVKQIKGTVLVLHGFAQNGKSFAIKASGIRKAFKKAGYHTVFIDGPLKLEPADMPFEPDRFNIQPSLDVVREAYKEHGPFIGLMGFSQGAGVLGAILSRYAEVVGDEKAADYLKFALIYSGFVYTDKSMEKFYDKKIELPTLHLMGELDTVVSNDRSQKLVDRCLNSTIMRHPGGHYVPSTKPLLRSEIAWVQNVVDGKNNEDGEEKPEDAKKKAAEDKKELDDLAKQMAKLGQA